MQQRVFASSEATAGTQQSPWPLVLVFLLGAVFLFNSSSWLDAGFGESHDGRNAAHWGLSSRALRSDPIDNRLGGELGPGHVYANHPPLIIAETAVAETVAGEHRTTTRAPAWLGSIVSLLLLTVLLLDAGLSPAAVATGVVSACGSGMFLVYGTMLDTPVTSLPFSLATLVAWQRCWLDRRVPPARVLVALGAFAGLAGWQSAFVAILATCTLSAQALRRQNSRRVAIALGGGTIIGLTATLSWIHWVYGSLEPLFDNRAYRSRGSGLVQTMHTQTSHLWALMPLALLLGAFTALPAMRDRRVRALFGLSSSAVIGYGLMFRGGAEMHDYWNFSVLVPIAIAIAASADHFIRRVASDQRSFASFGLCLTAVACMTTSVAAPPAAHYALKNGIGTVHLARVADGLVLDDGPMIAYLSLDGAITRWIDYETGYPGIALHGVDDLRALAAREPLFPTLIIVGDDSESQRSLRAESYAVDGPYALAPATAVLTHMCTRSSC